MPSTASALAKARVKSPSRLEHGQELVIEVQLDLQTHVVAFVEEVVAHRDVTLCVSLSDLWARQGSKLYPLTQREQLKERGIQLLLRGVYVDTTLIGSREFISATYHGRLLAVDPEAAYHAEALPQPA